ncbi:helix-turn-helix transcriptional regulator [Clostridium sp. D2Q-11]|uniref:Helix-turn-helix transcriptional regulator n=1 Tax=Anaeromonas frigoriresistens TaxID=2683708 RepID=A0A942UYV1_9FIRM|nr:XRE family transcriptional regulator [Anaeromonas frigoriresistens]MBS4540145.1 helix-turn-helix transcriptional regulator [Anaeromonas frigoriresistens]
MDIGKKIKELRIKNSLTQEELANRCELSKGFISQVERDLTSPSIATFIDILESLGTTLKDFFDEIENEKIVFTDEDMFISEDDEYKYELKWVIPNAQKNKMEPILVTLDPNGMYKEDHPHEGEEFGYVLSGTVYIYLGKKRYKAKKGDSFYYKANVNHYISNAGKNKAKILWVSTPPNF